MTKGAALALIFALGVLTGCARLPRAPVTRPAGASPPYQALLDASPWAGAAPVTIAQRGILKIRGKEYVFIIYAHQDREGIRQVVGCSEFGATIFLLRGTPGQPVRIVRNVSGLPERILRDGIWHDAVLALPLQKAPPLGETLPIRRQEDGSLVLALPGDGERLEWVYSPDPVACRGARSVLGDRICWQANTVGPPPPGSRVPRRWRIRHFRNVPYQIQLTLDVVGTPEP
ncbi:MAG: hypothetical protein HN904_21020 [Victivallales bacterium]|nr:hypothetical protein [Victivallales bacterium]